MDTLKSAICKKLEFSIFYVALLLIISGLIPFINQVSGRVPGEALAKQAGADLPVVTFLPDVRFRFITTSSGYSSYIVIRNNGVSPANLDITLYYPNGEVLGTRTLNALGVNASWIFNSHDNFFDTHPLPNRIFDGTAIVSSDQDLSVLVMHHTPGQSQDYSGIPDGIAPSGPGSAPVIYLPAYLNNYYHWNSLIIVQNAGVVETGVLAQFYTPEGNPTEPSYIGGVQPGGRALISNLDTGGNPIGSVRVWSDQEQDLAVLILHDCPEYGMSFETEGIGAGSNRSFTPTLFKNYYTWYTAVELQEISGVGGEVSITIIPPPPFVSPPAPFWLPANGQKEIYLGGLGFPNGWRGSAIINIDGGQLVTEIHHLSGNNIETLGYHGFLDGLTTLILPYVRNHPPGDENWITSVNVQNTETDGADIMVKYYNQAGTLVHTYTFSLDAGASEELINVNQQGNEMPNNFSGSVELISSRRIVAGVHLANTQGRSHHAYGVP